MHGTDSPGSSPNPVGSCRASACSQIRDGPTIGRNHLKKRSNARDWTGLRLHFGASCSSYRVDQSQPARCQAARDRPS